MASTKVVEKKKAEVAVVEGPPKLAITADDIEIARLNIIQQSSSIEGDVGSVVLDRSITLLAPEEVCAVIPVNAVKAWREDIPFGNAEIPRIASTQEVKEAIENDSAFGTIEFAEITLLFPKPEGADDDLYPFPIGDATYALGKVNVAKDGYRCTYKRLATFSAFNPDMPICAKMWKFRAELLTRGMNSWYVPSLQATTEDSPEDVKGFITRITS
jgi:hypothetical protein